MAQDPSETPVDEPAANPGGDVEMADEATAAEAREGEADASELPFAAGGDDAEASRVRFMTYLASPIVNLVVGQGAQQTLLAAHQGLLAKSPFFDSACQGFVDDGSVGLSPSPVRAPRR